MLNHIVEFLENLNENHSKIQIKFSKNPNNLIIYLPVEEHDGVFTCFFMVSGNCVEGKSITLNDFTEDIEDTFNVGENNSFDFEIFKQSFNSLKNDLWTIENQTHTIVLKIEKNSMDDFKLSCYENLEDID